MLKGGRPIYHIQRTIKEMDAPFVDGTEIIYVNASIREDSELGRLIHDFLCENPDDMRNALLAERARTFKTNEKEVTKMCEIMEEVRAEALEKGIQKGMKKGMKKGIQKGILENRHDTALHMLRDRMSVDLIARYTQLSVEKITELGRLHSLL